MNSGKPIVIDASAILAICFAEPSTQWVAEQLRIHAGGLLMSTVNAGEVMMTIRNRRFAETLELERQLLESGIRFVPVTIEHARRAAEARNQFPLNLGDCFAYALAAAEGCSILTLDEDFQRCDRPLIIP